MASSSCESPRTPSVPRSPSVERTPSPSVLRGFSLDDIEDCSSVEASPSREQTPVVSMSTATNASSTTSVAGDEQEACSAHVRQDTARKRGKGRKYDLSNDDDFDEVLGLPVPAEKNMPAKKKLRKAPLKAELQARNDLLQEKVRRLEQEVQAKKLQSELNESAFKAIEKSMFDMMVKGGRYGCEDCHV